MALTPRDLKCFLTRLDTIPVSFPFLPSHVILTIQTRSQAFHKKFYEPILTEMKKNASTKGLMDSLEQMRHRSICVLPTSPGKKKM
jgi:hypothetical protein